MSERHDRGPRRERRVLETRDITKTYHAPRGGIVHALADVDVLVRRGRTLGVVGESGSGKTTLTRQLLMLETPTSGDVVFEGRPLADLTGEELRKYRHAVAAVFQNPYSSLDPRLRIWQAITEQQAIERAGSKKARRARAEELLELVGLGARMAERYPHQLSGGQRQRVAVARAIAQDPEVVILDEPLSALDVSVSAQIVNLLLDLQERLGVTYLFVGHDLRLVRHLCHDVVVMYRGKVVESGAGVDVLGAAAHPYTAALVGASALTSLAITDDGDTKAVPDETSAGCPYRTRCLFRDEECDTVTPEPREIALGRAIRCHHPLDGGDRARHRRHVLRLTALPHPSTACRPSTWRGLGPASGYSDGTRDTRMGLADAADAGDVVLDRGEVVGDRLGALGAVEEVGEVVGQGGADARRPLDGVGELRRVRRGHRDDRVRARRGGGR